MNHLRLGLGFICAAILTAMLVAAGCGIPLEQYTEEIKGEPAQEKPSLPGEPSGPSEGGGGSYIAVYNLQAYVPVPVAGMIPVKDVTNRGDMVIGVKWMDEGGNDITGSLDTFEQDTVYQAEISLTAKNSYIFDPAVNFTYHPLGAVIIQPDENTHVNSRVLTPVTYKAAAVPAAILAVLDLTSYIPAPVTGGSPETSFYTGTYGGTVAWKTGGTPMPWGPFLGGQFYTAAVTLYSGAGYVFSDPITVSYDKAEGDVGMFTAGPGANQISGEIEFLATDPVVINNPVDLTAYIPAPVADETPVTTLSGTPAQYTGTVAWTKTSESTPHSGSFQEDTAYTATVTLSPEVGYIFPDSVTVSHDKAEGDVGTFTAVPDTNWIRGEIKFPTTDKVVDDLDLTSYITAPVTGGTVLDNLSSTPAQYMGTVAWTKTGESVPHSGSFQENTAYTATVTLMPRPGYTFTGVGENSFTHTGRNLSNEADSGVVTIDFPLTSVPVGGDW
jgi:hypothetical protein